MRTVLTFVGRNPFEFKAAVVQRWESLLAMMWIALSFLLSLICTVQGARAQQTQGLSIQFGMPTLIAVLAALALTTAAGSIRVAKCLAMHQALPILANLQREVHASAAHVIVHNGLRADQLAPGVVVSEAQREDQIRTARRRLDQVGTLLEFARQSAETDSSYAQRLGDYLAKFPAISLDE